jgi:hypothetical protein
LLLAGNVPKQTFITKVETDDYKLPRVFYFLNERFKTGDAFCHSTSRLLTVGYKSTTLYWMVVVLRWTIDLSLTTLIISWNKGDPNSLQVTEEHHEPPPLTRGDLNKYATDYNPEIVGFCRKHVGSMVGNGECAELASEALAVTAARELNPTMGIEMYERLPAWGYCIYAQSAAKGLGVQSAFNQELFSQIRAGDIIQFTKCVFTWQKKREDGAVETWKRGLPDGDLIHTAIVAEIRPSAQIALRGQVTVLEQNFQNVKRVQENVLVFEGLVEGTLEVFRPVSAAWGGNIEQIKEQLAERVQKVDIPKKMASM